MTPDEFAGALRSRTASGSRVIAGIAGEPGAGKSTVADAIAAALGPDAVVLPMDGFHLPQARLVELGRRERMGAPDTFDVDGFLGVLAAVRADGGEVAAPGFDRDVEEAVPRAIRIRPQHRVVIVEGNYLLLDSGGWAAVLPLLDASAYLAVDPALRLERLVARHIAHGKTADAARAWATGPDEANAGVIRATACRADTVLVVE